jgi:hypothetical protein
VNVREYFASIQLGVLAVPLVVQSSLAFDEVSEDECYIHGVLTLTGGYQLHIAEYVVVEPQFQRLKYRYHLQTARQKFVARWDNAPHHPKIPTHPNHFHAADSTVRASRPMDILTVLNEIVPMIG